MRFIFKRNEGTEKKLFGDWKNKNLAGSGVSPAGRASGTPAENSEARTRRRRLVAAACIATAFAVIMCLYPDTAAWAAGGSSGSSGAGGTGSSAITTGFNSLMDIVKALVTSIGSIVTLWGFFEWGTSMQSQDGVMQSSAFKRIGGGLIMILAPQLISAFT